MKIEEILTAMEDLLEDAWNFPMSGGKRVVNTTELYDLIADLRASLPEEIRASNEIIEKRDRIILKGREEADLVLATARAQADKMVSQESVYREAQQQAQDIIAKAQKNAKEMKSATVEYCDSIMSRTVDTLTKSCQAIEETRNSIQKQKIDEKA